MLSSYGKSIRYEFEGDVSGDKDDAQDMEGSV